MRVFERDFEGVEVKAYGSRNRYMREAERAYDAAQAGAPAKPAAPSFNFPKSGFSPGGFDVNALGNAPPLGGTTNNQTSSVTMTASTTIKIEGSSEPAATGAHVERAMNHVNDLSLRNVRGAIR